MAKVIGPALSVAASGRLGPHLVYRRAGGQNIVRATGTNTFGSTALQQAQRTIYAAGINTWTAWDLTTLDLSTWLRAASLISPQASRLNAFLREYIAVRRSNQTWYTLRWDSITLVAGPNYRLRVLRDVAGLDLALASAPRPGGPWTHRFSMGESASYYENTLSPANFLKYPYWRAYRRFVPAPYSHTGPLRSSTLT